MTLDDLWSKVNSNYATVKSLSNSVSLNLWSATQYWYDRLDGDLDDLLQANWSTHKTAFGKTWESLADIKYLIRDNFQLLDSKIDAASTKIDSLFYTYMNNVVRYIKDAVDLVWNEAVGGSGGFEEYVDDAIAAVQYQIATEIDAVMWNVDESINTVKSWIAEKYTSLTSWVSETYDEIVGWLDGGIESLWQDFKAYAGELFANAEKLIAQLYDDLGDAILAVRTSIINYYAQLKGYVDETLTKAKSYVDIGIENVKRAIVRSANEIQIWVSDLIDTINAGINLALKHIEDGLDQLGILSDWRFQFFNWSVIRPELAMLNMLTRTDETFNYWRPYWQAFFSRVLEET